MSRRNQLARVDRMLRKVAPPKPLPGESLRRFIATSLIADDEAFTAFDGRIHLEETLQDNPAWPFLLVGRQVQFRASRDGHHRFVVSIGIFARNYPEAERFARLVDHVLTSPSRAEPIVTHGKPLFSRFEGDKPACTAHLSFARVENGMGDA